MRKSDKVQQKKGSPKHKAMRDRMLDSLMSGWERGIKGYVHPKMEIQSLSAYPHVSGRSGEVS